MTARQHVGGSRSALLGELAEALLHPGERPLDRSRHLVVERDAPARRRDDLRDAAAHLAGADDEDVLEAHDAEANVRVVTTVRPATAADADAIGRIQVESWRAAYAGLLPEETIAAFDVEARRQMWREGLSRTPRPGSATFVAIVDEEIVGFATVGASQSEDETGELYAIYVHPTTLGSRCRVER